MFPGGFKPAPGPTPEAILTLPDGSIESEFTADPSGEPRRAWSAWMPASLTDIERRILDYMVAYLRRHTYQPSIREIGEQFGIKSTKTVSEHLHALAEKGYLERDPSRSRGVRILGVDLHPEAVSVPLFSAVPAAADARLGDDDGSFLTLDRRLVGSEGSYFVEAPTGVEALGIREGDYLLVEPVGADRLVDGDVVAVRVNGHRGFARFMVQGGGVQLHGPPFGDAPVAVEDVSRLPVLGRVVALFRRMDADQSAEVRAPVPGFEAIPLH